MLTVGIDLAAQPQDTAACEVQWHDTHAEIIGWHNPLKDEQILALIAKADKVGIDIPLGWPTEFVRSVYKHQMRKKWPVVDARRYQLRATDRFVHQRIKLRPLSVSTDRIGIPAARAARILSDFSPNLDRTGAGKIVEVYPAAALKVWGFQHRGYKGKDGAAVRGELVNIWAKATDAWGRWTNEALLKTRSNDNLLDALIAATVARCAALNLTVPVPAKLKRRAHLEGWIAVPFPGSLMNLFPAVTMES